MDSMLSSTLPKAEGSARSQPARGGGDGVLIWQSANGGPFAKTTAATGKLGHSSRSSMRTAAPIVGERTASRVSATTPCALVPWFGALEWQGRDSERTPFWAGGGEGNHGEDVKEVYHFVDATPTHSYQKMVYRYPQDPFPYAELVSVNKLRSHRELEFELVDTGVFSGARFFDVTIEFAKADPDDILMLISIENAAQESAVLHVLPQLWARNTWSWNGAADRPRLRKAGMADVLAFPPGKRTRRWSIDCSAELLFCENETNLPLLFGVEAPGPFKDGINDFIIAGRREAISAADEGSKVAAHVRLRLSAGASASIRLRWRLDGRAVEPFVDFDAILAARRHDADEFCTAVQSGMADEDARAI